MVKSHTEPIVPPLTRPLNIAIVSFSIIESAMAYAPISDESKRAGRIDTSLLMGVRRRDERSIKGRKE